MVGQLSARPRTQNGIVSQFGILWDIMGLCGRQEIGPNPPEVRRCGRSTPLTTVKLKETLPNCGRSSETGVVMWIGLFSDIHANREALETCLDHARRGGIERFIFLGDYVGYGADPGFAVDTIMREVECGAIALLGNHDAAISSGTGGMSSIAAEAIEWTRPNLDATQRDFLARLPLTFEDHGRLFVHASAHAPERWEYITSVEKAARSFMATRARITFCGHVHVPQLFHLSPTGKLAGFEPVQAIEVPLLVQRRWIAVIGSVGQPRDHNPAACYGALDVERNVLIYVRVPYDTETAARKIHAAGLPNILSLRIIEGT
jgi:diadenosine tetraphosphatase ApaH/serine/threonine PP2A family protein phosphatase